MKAFPVGETLKKELAIARIVMVIGAPDTGKTTLVTYIANHYFQHGQNVAVVDADVGQSDIGPPGTVGMGLLVKPVEHIREVPLDGFYFVGSLSPAGQIMRSVIGTRLMVDEAFRRGARRVVVDTTGLVAPPIGTALKEAKVDAIRPDLMVAIEHSNELGALLGLLRAFGHNVVSTRVQADVKHRNAEERQEYRRRRFARYFNDTHVLEVDLPPKPSGVFMKRCSHVPGQPLPRSVLVELGERLGITLVWGEKTSSYAYLIASQHLDEEHLGLATLFLGTRRVRSESISDVAGRAVGVVGTGPSEDRRAPVGHLAVGYIEGFRVDEMKILLRTPRIVVDQARIKALLLGDYKVVL